ncbi:MAG TPA: hypothetical protein VNH11_04255 [Pirellulales bacterium]|nr:hypothetical protein [Pirellulales bacterium]
MTIEQILEAVGQLSSADRRRLQRELARCEAAPAAKRMPLRRTRRMSELLLKANSGTLTSAEDAELNALVEEFESLTLASAQALAEGKSASERAGVPRRSPKP